MDINRMKEELSISYISAVSAMAGIDYEIIRHDQGRTGGAAMIYSEDFQIMAGQINYLENMLK